MDGTIVALMSYTHYTNITCIIIGTKEMNLLRDDHPRGEYCVNTMVNNEMCNTRN